MLLNLNKNDFTKILIFSFVFVMPKWFLSYYFFDEDITSKIINEIHGDGEFYLPFIKYFGEFNFSQSFIQVLYNSIRFLHFWQNRFYPCLLP